MLGGSIKSSTVDMKRPAYYPPPQRGEKAPDLELESIDGKMLDFPIIVIKSQ
jgi:hypothetical protein